MNDCLNCLELRERYEARITQIENELSAAVEGYHIESSNRMRAEREARRLKKELAGSTTPENRRVKEICEYHDELWRKTFPRAKGLSYPMDGKNAAAVRRALRWGLKVPEIKKVLDGAFQSDFHRSKAQYLYLESILRDENRIRTHLVRAEAKKKRELWPPMDRILLALRQRGLRWDGVYVGAQEEGRTWRNVAECPLCHDRMLVGVRDNGWASLRCETGCEFFGVLEALGVGPDELARKFDPAEVQALESAQAGFSPPQKEADARAARALPAPSRASDLRMAA